MYFASKGLSVEGIGLLKFVYPLVWSVLPVLTEALSDRVNRSSLIILGMTVQAFGLALFIATGNLEGWGSW